MKKRDAYYDNAKVFLVFFVLILHATATVPESRGLLTAARNWLATWMMPCFCMISGFLAQGFVKKDKKTQSQTLFLYLGYYLFAQILNILFDYYVIKSSLTLSLVQPKSTLWYLTSLIIWHMLLSFIGGYPKKWLIIGSLLIGTFAGYDSTLLTPLFSLHRAIPFFPFFVIGYCVSKESVQKLRDWKCRYVFGIGVLSIALIAVFIMGKNFPHALFVNHAGYEELNTVMFSGRRLLVWTNALFSYFISTVLSIAFLCLVPGKRIPFVTDMGTRSLQIYIYHRLPLYILYTYFKDSFQGLKGAVAVTVLFIVIGVIISMPVFEYPFRKIKDFSIKLSRCYTVD